MPLRFSIVLGQRAAWPVLLDRARETEALGFDGLYLVDHFFGLTDVTDPTHEAWTMLAALAPFTQRLRLGVLVSGNTYRNPVFLLKQAITVDHVSGGRVDFGVGAGWLEREHEAYGFELPAARERVDRFAEALEIWDLLQRQERTSYEGAHYRLVDAPFAPKSLQQPRLPLLIGASGPRMLRLTARHADIWNTVGTPQDAGALNRRLDEFCRDEGRDPSSLARAVSPGINLLASVDAFVTGVEAYRTAGFTDIHMPWPRTETELPVFREVARTVIPGLRSATGSANDGSPHAAGAATDSSHPIGPGDVPALAALYAGLPDDTSRSLLDELIDRPDELLEGAKLVTTLGLARHVEIARAIEALDNRFAALGLARPWIELPRGYRLPPEAAVHLSAARAAARASERSAPVDR